MSKSDSESPQGNLVNGRVVDVIGAVEADDGAESRPGAECAGAQGSDEGGCGTSVDLLGAGEGEVGLDAVAERDDGDLVFFVRLFVGLWELRRWDGSLTKRSHLGRKPSKGGR